MISIPAGWEAVIGLEVHVQLQTASKLFSAAGTDFGAPPNTLVSTIDCGLPGTLPVLNREAVVQAIRFGHAIGARLCHNMRFERKHYFYPDLPKGYQITQLVEPIVSHGHMDIPTEDGSVKRIRINRAHLEEDAGKSIHDCFVDATAIDLNRAGMPLLEVVSEPDISNSAEAVTYLKLLHSLVRWLGVSDGNMAEGSMRCDANVSVRPVGQAELGQRCEIKNVNSFRFVAAAIDYEIQRQIGILEEGGSIRQETRLYDESNNRTLPMRSKEESADYRYFPEPDLLPIQLDEAWVEQVRGGVPELPKDRSERYQKELDLPLQIAITLTSSREQGDYFEIVAEACGNPRAAAVWMTGDFAAQINAEQITPEHLPHLPLQPQELGALVRMLEAGVITGPVAKEVFAALWSKGGAAEQIVEERGLKSIGDGDFLRNLVDEIICAHPKQTEQYRGGKTALIGFFVGQVMKASSGRVDPKTAQATLREALDKD